MNIAYSPGPYRGRITRWGLSKAKTGTTQFAVSFVVIGKLDPNDPEAGPMECPELERTIFRAITDKTIDFVAQDLRNLGYDRDDFSGLDPTSPGAHDFSGKEIEVYCEHDAYQGNAKEKWRFSWGGGFEIKPVEQSEIKKLNALFGKNLRAVPAKAKAAPAAAGAALPEGNKFGGDDSEEIPF